MRHDISPFDEKTAEGGQGYDFGSLVKKKPEKSANSPIKRWKRNNHKNITMTQCAAVCAVSGAFAAIGLFLNNVGLLPAVPAALGAAAVASLIVYNKTKIYDTKTSLAVTGAAAVITTGIVTALSALNGQEMAVPLILTVGGLGTATFMTLAHQYRVNRGKLL